MTIAIVALAVVMTTSPDPTLTPGQTRPLSLKTICTTKWGLDQRHVTVKKKREVLALYGLTWADRFGIIFDHLIPRSLGGADEVRDLWPQPKAEAHLKDVQENRLHRAVCAGEVSLASAQAEMRSWGR